MVKKPTAMFLILIMLCTAVIPAQVFAEGDKGLETAISAVRSKIDIPEDFTFDKNYNVYTQPDGKRIWYLRWCSKDELKGEISVRADDNGTIYGYDRYIPYNYSDRKKLPKISREDALEPAKAFIEKVNPDVVSSIELDDNVQRLYMESDYYFNFYRVEDGIPVYENNIYVTVDRDTGEVRNYNFNWTDDLVFPDASKKIPPEEAEKAYKEKMGLKLIYKYAYDYEDEEIKIFPAYVPIYNSSYAIDALTGELTQTGYYWYDRGMGGNGAMAEKSMASVQDQAVRLSPEELEAANEASKFISRETAEKIAREFDMLSLTDDFKLTYAWLSRAWPDRDEFVWSLDFSKEPGDNSKDYRYASISINAVTREIIGFYTNIPYVENAVAKYDEADAKAAAEKFLKEFKPEIFEQTEYDSSNDGGIIIPLKETEKEAEKPLQYDLTYTRLADGIPFPDNSLRVGYDAVNGKIYSFNMTWFNNAKFPAVSKDVTPDKAYEKMFDDIGLELQYKFSYNDQYDAKIYLPVPESTNVKVKLVYALNTGKPWMFDPETGAILDYNGKPYEEIKTANYSDIAKHYAEDEIKILAEYGISLEGDEFRPDDSITQKDFLTLIAKTLSDYYVPVSSRGSDKETDAMYTYLMRYGIIKEGEKDPDAVITREDGVKFIIRALKYDKVADIKGIYTTIFKDQADIDPDLIGYVSIAQGLNIINGYNGYFNPKGELTRAQAAIIIYNYLLV